ncbi:COMM domain-containing protein 4 [Daktulosphaira vitifoliae]|uniref:COMM domain-containing protein 4 n=1 Tax=Daktulosphaira vitifoliae TaxID=58002 RepID=UPI0021A987A9|nr:COMM domain-containing protein 4 [Daktulosphaira vitifoliae]XP_050545375.1 COMM domain-containing protein 4 [Daktulosphaira vitifoliae]
MKFKFCGGGDCPEWLLVQINALSRMTSVKMRLLAQHTVNSLLGEPFNLEKAKELMADAKLEGENCKACVAAITFILKKAACHAVPQNYLSNELQQIGLPREHALALCKVYGDNLSEITKVLRSSSLKIGKLSDISVSKEIDNGYLMKLKYTNSPGKLEEKNFTLSKNQIQLLIAELSDVSKRMADLTQDCKE